MNGLLRSLRRIVFALAIGVSLILAVVAAVVRQPSIRSLAYPKGPRSSADILRRHVEFFTATVRPRGADQPENLDRAAAYIGERFREAGARVSEQAFIDRGRTYRNVIADFGPLAGDKLIVGAHYDAFTSTGDLPGADDNASGTAGLLELARLLGICAPRRPVELVAFTTEEPPFFGSEKMGSAVHAAQLQRSHRGVAGMICLEMIGYFRGEQTWQSPLLGMMYPSKGDFIAVTGGWPDRELGRDVKAAIRGAAGIDVYSFTGPREMLDASDQRNYWSRGW
ncbi:MAG TPA: M28 family peptidase, partial [Thermoanaerobaculia bacterium]|nr:M28 family peptidase [Thermoanaerobaculia bacterium]